MTRKGSKKSPIQPKTKEQLEHEIQMASKRAFVIKEFYPALETATISVDEATQLLNASVSLIMEESMQTLRTMKMKEIKNRIVHKLCPNDERLLQIEALFNIFDGQTLFEARGHMESMKAVISQMTIEDMMNRKLETMNPKWDKYLN